MKAETNLLYAPLTLAKHTATHSNLN